MGGWTIRREVSDFAFNLTGEDPSLEQFARRLYSSACRTHQPEADGSDQPDDTAVSFRLSKRHDHFVFSQGNLELCRGTDLGSFFRQAEWALTKAAMRGLDRYFQVHAGAVASRNGRVRLIVGPPDSGKTTLVLACAEAGARILSDEIALVRAPDLIVEPFLRDLVVHDGTAAAFGELLDEVDEPPWKSFSHYRFVAPEAVSQAPPTKALVTQLIFPSRRPGGSTVIERLGQAAAAELLLAQIFNGRSWGARGVELMAQMIERCTAYAVRFDDARSAARCLPGLEVQI